MMPEKSYLCFFTEVANSDPLELPEGTDAEQTPDVNEEEGEREALWIGLMFRNNVHLQPESIEKSLPHNLQEPNSRGEDNREERETPDVNEEDGEREVLSIDWT